MPSTPLSLDDAERYPFAARSAINFGIPPLAGLTLRIIDLNILENLLRQSVIDFEPRILGNSLRVRANLTAAQMSHNALTFEIEGELWGQPMPTTACIGKPRSTWKAVRSRSKKKPAGRGGTDGSSPASNTTTGNSSTCANWAGNSPSEFPKIAGRLGLEGFECADPYVERLLEGFSFLAGRVQLKMDAEFPRVHPALCWRVVYPALSGADAVDGWWPASSRMRPRARSNRAS
jgi:hypothetical protein